MLVGAYVFSCILGVPMIFFSKGAMYFFHSLWKTTCTSLFCSTVVHFRSPTFPYTAVYFISLFKKTDEAFILWYLMFLQLKCYRYKKNITDSDVMSLIRIIQNTVKTMPAIRYLMGCCRNAPPPPEINSKR